MNVKKWTEQGDKCVWKIGLVKNECEREGQPGKKSAWKDERWSKNGAER
jgi:hypothetical protein